MFENRKLMMVVPSWSIVLTLGGTEQERYMGEMTFYMTGVVMTWNKMIRWTDKYFPEFAQVFPSFGKMALAALEMTPFQRRKFRS